MSVFVIKKSDPNWQEISSQAFVSAEPVLSTQRRAYEASIDALAEKYGVSSRLDYDIVSDTKMATKIGRKVLTDSHPMRELRAKYSLDRMVSWETFTRCFATPYIDMISKRRAAATAGKTVAHQEQFHPKIKVRSFHVGATDGELETMLRIINRVMQTSGARIEWVKLLVNCGGQLSDQYSQSLVKSADGCELTAANRRAWHNQMQITMKGMDFFIDTSRARGKLYSIVFALTSTSAGGHCVIALPGIGDSQLAFAVCLFVESFETTRILHSVIDDRVFLYGENFLSANQKGLAKLEEIAAREDGHANYAPALEQFAPTVESLLRAYGAINNWRYNYYDRILAAAKHLTNSYSAATFDHYADTYISDHFPDDSQRWLAATDFPREWM